MHVLSAGKLFIIDKAPLKQRHQQYFYVQHAYYNVSTDYILGISESEYKAETPEDRNNVPGLH